jgi:D-alanine transaminase/branched-chain amino acid aminotransferase
MYNYHFLNGNFVPLSEANLSIGDIGIVRGYGIFDFFQVVNGVPLHIEEHINRFLNSAKELRLDIGYDATLLKEYVNQLIKINDIHFAGIKFLATGGFSSDGFDIGAPTVAILCHPYKTIPDEFTDHGAKLLSHEYVRSMPTVKTTNYIMAIYLSEKVKQQGAIEPLYYSKASVSECSRSNIFAVFNDKLVTPDKNILLGISRNQVIKLAGNLGYPVEQRDIPLGELLRADEVFITGTLKKVLPIVNNSRQIG